MGGNIIKKTGLMTGCKKNGCLHRGQPPIFLTVTGYRDEA